MARKRTQGPKSSDRLSPYAAWHLCREREKVHLSLPAEVARRLGAYARYHRVDLSDVAAQALMVEMKGFVVHQRGEGPARAEDSPALPSDGPQDDAGGGQADFPSLKAG